MPKTICIDFDGPIHDYKGWEENPTGKFGGLTEGAERYICFLKKEGWEIIIFTSRGEIGDIKRFLSLYGIPWDYMNESPYNSNINSLKPIADVYLDDRGITFREWNDDLVREIISFEPNYQITRRLNNVGDNVYGSMEDFLEGIEWLQAKSYNIMKRKAPAHGLQGIYTLGRKGIFAQIDQKFWRIKTVVWDREESDTLEDERIDDSLLDMANYCYMLALYIKPLKKRR